MPVAQRAVNATVGWARGPRLSWTVTAGAIVDGEVEGRDLAGGGTGAGAATWLAVLERPARPFVAVSGSLGASLARALADDGRARTWTAVDLRAGAMVGKTLGPLVPYAAARAFGGPVFWRRGGALVVGGDRYHVTAGAGLVVRAGRAEVSAELMPLGEQAASVAVTWRR